MKRQMIIGLMLAAAFTLTNCSEQLVSPEKEQINVDDNIENTTQKGMVGEPYEVFVDEPATKTVSDGNNLYWIDEATALANNLGLEEVDRATLYSINGTEGIICHGKYTYAGNQKFVGSHYGTLLDGSNWYCIYPYVNSQPNKLTEIKETVIIGASKDNGYKQEQLALNSKVHIAGKNYPLYGIATNVSASETPKFQNVNHLSALVAINIVNDSDGGIYLEQLDLESQTYPIVGEFEVDFTNGTPSVNIGKTADNSQKAILTLTSSETSPGLMVPAKSSAKFYMAVAPVEDKFTIRVNGTSITKDMTIPLESGIVTTLKVTIPKLHGTQSTNTATASGVDFVSWPSREAHNANINGHTDVKTYTVADNSITITGKIKDFLGSESNNGALPVSFYAASKLVKATNGDYAHSRAQLDVASVALYCHVLVDLWLFKLDKTVDLSFTGEDLSRKMNDMRVGFELSPLGNFNDDLSNLIVLDEAANYYYIDESKANRLIKSAGVFVDSDGDGVADDSEYFTVQDFRNAIFSGTREAWQKIYALVEKLAPGQFAENNAVKDSNGNVIKEGEDSTLVQLLDLLLGDAMPDEARALVGGYIQDALITIVLQTTGEAVCWGLNVQSPDTDLPKKQ